jgi:hypothetical protein
MMRAIRGQPNRGLRREFDDGLDECLVRPFDPGFVGHGVDENSRRYLPRTDA